MAISSRIFTAKKTIGQGRVDVEGPFAPAGTGDPTDVHGVGFTIARTGVGVFTVTFDDDFIELVSCVPGVQLAAYGDTSVHLGTWTSATRVLQLRVNTGGSAADIDANANNRIHFRATFRASSVATR